MLDWWRRFSLLGKVAGIVAAVTGAVIGVATAWPFVEAAFPAHRGYVIEQVGDVRTPVNELLIWKFEDTKNRSRGESAGWNIKLPKEQDPETRAMMQREITRLEKEQHELDARIKTLRGK